MSERERWIVYPLLFFALGAAIRDKLFRHVASKEVVCETLVADEIICRKAGQFNALLAGELTSQTGISCQHVVVHAPNNPELHLVELGAAVTQPAADRSLGVLVLRDDQGNEFCGVTNDQLYVKSVVCEDARVVANKRSTNALIRLGSGVARDERTGKAGVVGIVSVNNQNYFGAPGQRFTPLPQKQSQKGPPKTAAEQAEAAPTDEQGEAPRSEQSPVE